MNSVTRPSAILENMFSSPEVSAYVTFDKLVEAGANSPRPSRRSVPAPKPGPAPFRPSALPEGENLCISDMPWYHASSDRLVRAAANSTRLARKRLQMSAVSEKKTTAPEHWDDDCRVTSMQQSQFVSQPPFRAGAYSPRHASRPAQAPRPVSPPSSEDEEDTYTSRPQIRRPPTSHRFSAFFGECDLNHNREGVTCALRPSRFQRLKAKTKKALRHVRNLAVC